MDNNISTDLSFKAKLVSKMTRRPKVLNTIGKDFAMKTNNYELPMMMLPGGEEYLNAVFFELKDKVPTSFCITNADERLGINKKNLTSLELDNATNFLVKIYKILREQKTFYVSNESIDANIFSAKKALYGNERLLTKALISKKDNLIKTYQTLVKSNAMRLQTLKKEKEKVKDNYLSRLQFIAGEDKQLQDYVKCERKFSD